MNILLYCCRHCQEDRDNRILIITLCVMRDIQSMIQTRYFIADPALIRDMEEQFSLLSSDDNSWSRTYLNPVTGERWLMHTLDSSSHAGGNEIF